jgi:O-antigen ligase
VFTKEKQRLQAQGIMEWLLFLYPVSLAIDKTSNNVVWFLLLVTAVFCLARFRQGADGVRVAARLAWILALTLPVTCAAVQHFFLTPPLPLRDFDDVSRYLLCIPIYFGVLTLRPSLRPFLWGCVLYIVYTVPLMIWHMQVAGLERGISPNGFLGIIPHTSLSIILGIMALQLVDRTGPRSRARLLPVFLMAAIVAVPQTRSGLLLALIMTVVVWLLIPERSVKALVYGGGFALVAALMVLSNSQLWTRGDNTVKEIVAYSSSERPALTSATIRIELWRAAGRMFAEHPVLGVGNHGFRDTLQEYKAHGKAAPELENFTHPHNDVLKQLAENGLLGLLSLGLLYFVPLTIGLRAYRRAPSARNPALLLIVFSLGFLIAGLVDVILAWYSVMMFYGLVASLLIARIDTVERLAREAGRSGANGAAAAARPGVAAATDSAP